MMSEKMLINMRSLGLIGLLGGLGGAINAWLCYARLPVPVGEVNDPMTFAWPVIPLGFVHGSLLALIGIGVAFLLWKQKWFVRLIALPVVGWIAGWLSYIPLHVYIHRIFGKSKEPLLKDLLEACAWPFSFSEPEVVAFAPYMSFGLVGVGCFLLLNLCRQGTIKALWRHLLVGSVSGILGSLWWWIGYKPWYFSLIHGTIWGSLVGFGVWKSQRAVQRLGSHV